MKTLRFALPDGTELEVERFGGPDADGRYQLCLRRWQGSQYRGQDAKLTADEFKAFLLKALGDRVTE